MIRSQDLKKLDNSTFQETQVTGFLRRDAMKTLITAYEREGGFTVLQNDIKPERYVVGLQGFQINRNTIPTFFEKGIDVISELQILTKDAVGYGVWKGGNTIYFDTIYVTDNLEEAKRIGKENAEIAIYDRLEDIAITL